MCGIAILISRTTIPDPSSAIVREGHNYPEANNGHTNPELKVVLNFNWLKRIADKDYQIENMLDAIRSRGPDACKLEAARLGPFTISLGASILQLRGGLKS